MVGQSEATWRRYFILLLLYIIATRVIGEVYDNTHYIIATSLIGEVYDNTQELQELEREKWSNTSSLWYI